jgi:anti-anti-sigma regulatory factor
VTALAGSFPGDLEIADNFAGTPRPPGGNKGDEMPVKGADACVVMLEGEWSMDRASDNLEFLTGKFQQILEADPRPDRIEIDMAGLSYLGACGCQLLVVFLENLRRHEITPVPCSIPQLVMDNIGLLGFTAAFATPVPSKRESV